MALTDALLLDPYFPFEVWIAYRDGNGDGNGTLNDPYDGSPGYSTPLTIGQLSFVGIEATAKITGHPYQNGDTITIAGVKGNGAASWNGTFQIYAVNGDNFKYSMSSPPVDVAALDASSTAAKVLAFRLDDVMRTLPDNACVHFGPTPLDKPFLTRGYREGDGTCWQLKAGMKITGAGVDATVLRLVGVQSAAAHFYAMGHDLTTGGATPSPNPRHFVEIGGMTIDCNLAIPSGTAMACGAI